MTRPHAGLVALVVVLILPLTACFAFDSGPTAGAPANAGEIEPNVVKGRVTNARGEPLPGVQVGADNTLHHGSYLFGVTDENGYYRIDLSAEPNLTWRMFGTIEVDYEGHRYTQDLHVDKTAFAGSTGAIRDMEWRIEGPRPESEDAFYGGKVYIYEGYRESDYDQGNEHPGIEDMELVEVTFEPTAPLIDGSQGETIVRSDGGETNGIPIGKYRVSARYHSPHGDQVELVIRERDTGEYTSAVEVVFNTEHLLELEVLHPG
ncbi:carboxypeptidase-like regulatory domain-containing protein [Enemella sp. A6]|uniref:carboxypeptidase-like regulatory domain-containing protein n=1 Tax=Enemella sp. A6 TaxID=3440152 RepID=UPI003EB9C9F9